MKQKKRVVMDPVGKGKINPAVIKKAVREVTSNKRKAGKLDKMVAKKAARETLKDHLFKELVLVAVAKAKENTVSITRIREGIIDSSKKLRLTRKELAEITFVANFAYLETLYKEALRPQKLSAKR